MPGKHWYDSSLHQLARKPRGRWSRWRGTLSLVVASALTLAGVTVVGLQAAHAAPPAGYVPKSALINGDSVTANDGITDSGGNPISLEQYAAQRAGFTVTVATGAQWAAMTAADFAKYQLLIIGDPHCDAIPTSVTDNAATWASVVMGTSGQNSAVGNRALIGTDPEYHYQSGGAPTDPTDPSTAGAEHLVQSGITYAGGASGATGVYFDTTCGDNVNGTEVSILNSLSAVGTGFGLNAFPPCGGSVQLIASNPAFSIVTDTDIQGWNCSDHTTYPTYPTDWQPLAVATDAPTQPTCGTDPITNTTACGEAYVLVAGQGIVVTAPNLALTPATNSDPAGGSHTVTATVTQSGSPLSGQTVSFQVTGQNAGVTGTCAPASCVTDAAGKVTFTYPDTNGVGTDTINASVTIGGSTQHATASQTWTAAANHAPVANDVSATTPQDTPVAVTLTATDADGDSLTYAVVANPSHGTLSGTAPNLTYTPNAGYTGADSFTFKANDGQVDSNTATASITVTAVNRPPVANPQSVSTPQDTPVNVTLAGSDPDGDAITYVVVGSPAHGTLSGTAPNLTYTPNAGYTGPDSFTFKTNDGKLDSPVATVSITVTPISPTCPASAPSVDTVVSADQKTAASRLVSHAITTSHAGELILAFVEVDGPTAPTQQVTSMTGGGLTWTLAARANETWGSTEVWQAYATSTLSSVKVTAKLAKPGYDGSITLAAFSGAAKSVGAIATNAGLKGGPSAKLIPATCNGLIWAAGHDWSRAVNPIPASSQVIVHKFIDTRVHDSFWTQRVVSPTTVGAAVTVADTGPVKDRWTLAAVEIPAA